jgi:hypothetical protein
MSDENEISDLSSFAGVKAPEGPPDPNAKDQVDELLAKLNTTTFSLRREEHKFQIKDANEKIWNYILYEANDEARSTYMDFSAKMSKLKDDGAGKVKFDGIRDIRGQHRKLVSLCCVCVESNKAPTEEELKQWPGKLVTQLHDIIARISGLDNKAEARAKNS